MSATLSKLALRELCLAAFGTAAVTVPATHAVSRHLAARPVAHAIRPAPAPRPQQVAAAPRPALDAPCKPVIRADAVPIGDIDRLDG